MLLAPPDFLLEKAKNIRLAFFDIDGTLLDSQGQVADAVKVAIKKLQAMGVTTAIASGRPYFAAQFLVESLGLNGAGSFYTGAHLYDPRTQTTLAHTLLANEDAARVLAEAQRRSLYLEVYAQDGFYLEQSAEPLNSLHEQIAQVHSAHLRALPQRGDLGQIAKQKPLSKLLIGVNLVEQGDVISELEILFPHLLFARAYLSKFPEWQFASVIAGSANKQNAFDQLLAYHGVSAEQVIAFGDAESDIDFLRMSALGVAMDNAAESVKQVADWVTTSADEAGVAYAISTLFPELN